MRLQRYRPFFLLATLSVTSACGMLACSADGGGGEPDDSTADAAPGPDTGADATSTPDAKPPTKDAAADHMVTPVVDAGKDAKADATVTVDAGVDSSATVDASDAALDSGLTFVDATPGVDAGFDPTGAACVTPNQIQQRICGKCGIQKRVCFPGDGGATWLGWGLCDGEKADAGLPNSQVPLDCGMCGVQLIIYDNLCNASIGFCNPTPGAQCERGSIDWAPGLSCAGELGRQRSCDNSCHWDAYSDCQTFQNPANMTIAGPADAGVNIATGTFKYAINPKHKRLLNGSDTSCPIVATGLPVADTTGYAYVAVKNPFPHAATVSLWHSALDTQIAVYAGGDIPADDVARRACITGTKASEKCPTTMTAQCGTIATGNSSTAGVTSVKIPANGTITVYNALSLTTGVAGPFTLSVRTDSLQ